MTKSVARAILISLISIFSYSGYSQYTPYSDFEPTVLKGSTVIEQVYSPSLEGNLQGNPTTRSIKVYLPPGYDELPNNMYPVVYLLHGYPGDHNDFNSTLDQLGELITNKIVIPTIIAIPYGSTSYGGSFFTNSYVSGNWEDYVVQDVIQHMESKYQVLDQSEYIPEELSRQQMMVD